MQTVNYIFIAFWCFVLGFGLGLVLCFSFNWQIVKKWYFRNQGEILLSITFIVLALCFILLDFINLIKLY